MAETTSTTTSKTPARKRDRIEPVPGDPTTEPVATAAQSHVPGRVGPVTVPEDATATWQPAGDGLDEVEPGVIRADTPEGTGPVPPKRTADPVGEHLAAIAQRHERERDRPKVQGPVQA